MYPVWFGGILKFGVQSHTLGISGGTSDMYSIPRFLLGEAIAQTAGDPRTPERGATSRIITEQGSAYAFIIQKDAYDDHLAKE